MNASTLIGIVASLLLLACVLLLSADTAMSFINLPGLLIVIAGTLSATFISYPLREVVRLARIIRVVFHRENSYVEEDVRELVAVARLWFQGDIRAVERTLEQTRNPFLRTGVQLVIDNTKEAEIIDLLRWRIARLKARELAEAQILRTMAAYAPAFGMIGTLVGLVNMLQTMSAGDITIIGPSMAVALLSTFYGILIANLICKPIAVKLERRTEQRLIAMNMVLEGVSLIAKRRLPSFVEETLNSFIANYHDEIRDSLEPGAGNEAGNKGARINA